MKSDRNELNLKGKSEIFCSLLIVVMSDKHFFNAMYEHISAICLPVTVVHYLKMSCEIAVFSDRSVQSAQKSFLQSLRLIRPELKRLLTFEELNSRK
jgi:hypothetical protein